MTVWRAESHSNLRYRIIERHLAIDSVYSKRPHVPDLVASQKVLLANASHELRTPLARIRMAIELMKESAALDPRSSPRRWALRVSSCTTPRPTRH